MCSQFNTLNGIIVESKIKTFFQEISQLTVDCVSLLWAIQRDEKPI